MFKFRWETESKQTEIGEISKEWEEEESSFRIPLLNPEILSPERSYRHLCCFIIVNRKIPYDPPSPRGRELEGGGNSLSS